MKGTAIRARGESPGRPESLDSLGSEILSISCPVPGSCAAGGDYTDFAGDRLSLVLSQRHGRWTDAIQVPGTAALGDEDGQTVAVSCGAAGSCAAGGAYAPGFTDHRAFVASMRGGIWRNALEVPGTQSLNTGHDAWILSESCSSAGNCTAGGFYALSQVSFSAFLVSQRNGTWGKAFKIPGLASLNGGKDAIVYSVSCPAAGDCAAGGFYRKSSGRYAAYVIDERHGKWGTARTVLGTSSPSISGVAAGAAVDSLSCATGGNCTAGGYRTSHGKTQAFVVTERNGHWGKSLVVPGTAVLNGGGLAQVIAVSCASPGDCAAGGYYTTQRGHSQAFLINERRGKWGMAFEVAGTKALNRGGEAAVNDVSCTRPGRCSAVGFFAQTSHTFQAFVVTETR